MNRLSTAKRIQVISALVEGCSIRSTCRMTGVSKATVMKLLAQIGEVCLDYQDEHLRGLTCQRVQCDEIWSFVGAKRKSVQQGARGEGDIWTWTSLDADTKLIISWLVGDRDADAASDFMHDLAGRIVNRTQLTTDGHSVYLQAVIDNFGPLVDYAQLVKMYGDDRRSKNPSEAKYSPPECVGCNKYARIGMPDYSKVSTSYVERSNLTMRMHIRRFTRLTNAFSKKLENHCHAIALYFQWYNYCKPHKTLKGATPAMAAGLEKDFWEVKDIVALLENQEDKAIRDGAMKRGPYRKVSK